MRRLAGVTKMERAALFAVAVFGALIAGASLNYKCNKEKMNSCTEMLKYDYNEYLSVVKNSSKTSALAKLKKLCLSLENERESKRCFQASGSDCPNNLSFMKEWNDVNTDVKAECSPSGSGLARGSGPLLAIAAVLLALL